MVNSVASPESPEVVDLVGTERAERTEERIVEATLACVARCGIAKTTLDDVAREAGCARATIYRYFPGKGPLMQAVAEREGARIAAVVIAAGQAEDTLEDAVVAMMRTAAAELLGHRALGFVMTHEPALILPFISFEGADRFLADAAATLAPTLARFVPSPRAERAAEWGTRVLLAHLAPDGAPRVAVTDERAARELVRTFVLPGLTTNRLQVEPSRTEHHRSVAKG